MSEMKRLSSAGGGAGGAGGGGDKQISKEVSEEIAKHERRVDAIENYVFENTPEGYLDRRTQLHSRIFKGWPESKRDYKLISQNFDCYREGLEREYKKSQELGYKYYNYSGRKNDN